MARFLLFLLGALTAGPGQRRAVMYRAGDLYRATDQGTPRADPDVPAAGPAWAGQPGPQPALAPRADGYASPAGPPAGYRADPGPRRRRVAPWVKAAAGMTVVGLIFRKAIASVVLIALSAALHFLGISVHLPSIKFAWPWQTISAGTTANTDLGPWVLQKIEGISKPAFGQENFNFLFTHKVSKNIGPWPCWYASTFYAVGHASATVDLNPGAAWWAPASGHYRLQVLRRPSAGRPGAVSVMMVLPLPQLPQSIHDVSIDDIPSKPIATQHSWTYPGFGCGVLVRPQFAQSVLYSQAQQIAFYRSSHVQQVTGPLIKAAEAQAARTIRDSFIQPTVNAFGYSLNRFTLRWAAAP